MLFRSKLENQPRRIYTGSIGFISHKNESVFNVAIRTILIDKKNGAGEMGIGSGIVYDSDPKKEYNECRLKAEFLTKRPIDFKLIETILWEAKKGYFLLEIHLERLLESAAYFGFLYDKKELTSALKKRTEYFNKSKNYKVRLLLDRDGAVSITSEPLRNEENERLVTFSKFNTSSSDIFLFHKTTKRDLYERKYKDCKKKGFYDFIFQNEKGEVTEGTISNIFVKKGNIYYTPPVNSGLLNGVYRRYILKNKIFPVQEKILYRKDIENATEIYLTNAVRKMVKVKLVER